MQDLNKKMNKIINKVVYHNYRDLINSPNKKSEDYFIIQALLGTAFALFTGGVFQSGFLIYLGASDQLVSYLALIPSICGILLIFCGTFVEGFKRRRSLVLITNGITKFFLISIIFVPLFIPKHFQIQVIYFLLILGYTINGVSGLAINSWFISVIPTHIRGRYFAIRQVFAVIVSIIVPVAAGRLVDVIPNKYNGFLILYLIAIVMAVGESIAFSRIQDPEKKTIDKKHMNIINVFRIPLRNKEFMHYTIILLFFYMVLYFSASFTQLYMLRYLKLSYTFISILSTFAAFLQVFFYRMWGRISDKSGSNFVMIASIWFYAIEAFMWVIMTQKTLFFIIPFIFVIGAIQGSGFATGAFNRRYEIIPEEGRSLYDAFFLTCLGLALLVSPFIGGLLRNFFGSIPFVQQNIPFGDIRLVYAVTSISIIALQLFVIYRKKGKNVNENELSKL